MAISIVDMAVKEHTVANNTFLLRNGWDIAININGYHVPKDKIKGNITITKEENQSTLCTFTIYMTNATDFIDSVWGKAVVIDYITFTSATRLFTGLIDVPEISLLDKTITFQCSNRRDELINQQMTSAVKSIGRYSEEVSGSFTTVAEELDLRLQTVAASLDFTSSNVPVLNSWYVNATPHLTLTNSDIYTKEPNITWQSRTKIKNQVSTTVSYKYTRLYHMQRSFYWRAPFADSLCDFLVNSYSVPSIQMVEDAIEGAGWRQIGSTTYENMFDAGTCPSDSVGIGYYAWKPNHYEGQYVSSKDNLGNIITDSIGNSTYTYKPYSSQQDINEVFTLSAQWIASTRFSQFIKESFPLVIQATQSINQFGLVAEENSYDVENDFDETVWEDYKYFTPQPPSAVTTGGGSYYENQSYDVAKMQNAVLTAIDRAKTDILESHRDTQVNVQTPLIPAIELSYTVLISTNNVSAKGKCMRIEHILDIQDGKGSMTDVTIVLFRSQGSGTNTPTTVPARPAETITIPSDQVTLQSHYGEDPETAPGAESWTGHIGNKSNRELTTVVGVGHSWQGFVREHTEYQESFIVETPPIPDSLRKERELIATPSTYEVEIPNDLLVITFDETFHK